MIDKRILSKYKHLLIGEEIRVGGKKFTFIGCGPIKIKFNHKVSGIDKTQASIANLWVRYEDLNEVVEEQLIIALRRHGVKV